MVFIYFIFIYFIFFISFLSFVCLFVDRHGNIQGQEDTEWEGIVVHFSVVFPSDYPICPPRVRLFSFIPHLNVQVRNGMFEVCLHMLESQPLGSLTTPYQYWSTAFSIRSILIQMSSFLLCDGQPTEIATGNIQRARIESLNFSCSACKHTITHHNPPLPRMRDILESPMSFPCVEVSGESIQLLQSRILERREKFHQEMIMKQQKQREKELELELKKESNEHSNEESKEESKQEHQEQEKKTEKREEKKTIVKLEEKKNTTSSIPTINQEKKMEEDVWKVVTRKGKKHQEIKSNVFTSTVSTSLSVAPTLNININTNNNNTNNNNNLFSILDVKLLESYKCNNCHKKLKENFFTRSQLKKGNERKCLECMKTSSTTLSTSSHPLLSSTTSTSSTTTTPMKKVPGAPPVIMSMRVNQAALRKENKRQLKEKKAIKDQEMKMKMDSNSNSQLTSQDKEEKKEEERNIEEKEEEEVEITPSQNQNQNQDQSQDLIIPMKENLGEWKNIWRNSSETSLQTDRNMGILFQSLNRDTAVIVLSFLEVNDVLSLSLTCRGVASICDDWLVWRNLFRRRYSRSALTPKGPNNSWKIAFMLESNCLSEDLKCFTSFATKHDSVLGFPITYTTNPKTGCLDYATSTFDILSLDSFTKGNIRKTVWGERFTDFLPIYIDEDHFKRGLSQLSRVSRKIIEIGLLNLPKHNTNNNNNNSFNNKNKHYNHNHNSNFKESEDIPIGGAWMPRNDPEMILTLLTKMMNTQVVLLCDKGISASEVALMGYCQLHRLLLAVVDHFPQLRLLIRKRLDDFVHKPETRVKTYTPSLGELLGLLSVSDSYSWQEISLAYIKESFDRSVLWSCSKDPSLAEVVVGDESRLSKYLTTQKVSMRLTLFHAVFLNLLVQGGGSKSKLEDCADRYDTFQGRPPLYVRRKWQELVNEILEFDSWPQYFSISKIPLPSKSFLLSTLEQAVKNSLKKGYHSKDTIFQNVMKSGVSRILLKGETYSAAPNLKRIQMIESWRYDGPTIFLDASCLVYDFNGQSIEEVDYSNTHAYTTTSSGFPVLYIEHSGDIIDYQSCMGHHTINIDISLIPKNVGSLFFTVSAWTTTLREIYQPSVQLHDSVSDTEMCRYKLEDENTGDKTAVIMCKLHRGSVNERWKMTSIGHVGYGRAGNYTSLHRDIRNFL